MKKLLMVAGVSLLVLLISGALVGVALADDPPDSKGGIGQTFIGKVAKFLGVTDQQVKDAAKKAQLEMVDEAVAAGKLTQEQANEIKARIEKSGGLWGPPNIHPPKGRWDGADLRNQLQVGALADFLGMKPAELLAEIGKGKTLAQIGQEHGKSRDQMKTAILSAVQKRVDEAVANGKMTQEQAKKLVENASAGIEKLLDRSFKAPPVKGPQGPNVLGEIKAIADFLGMKPEDLTAALKQGKTLAQIGQEHGKIRDELKTAIISAVQKRVDEAVAAGKLTQEQANKIVEKANAEVDQILDRSLKANGPAPKGKAPVAPRTR